MFFAPLHVPVHRRLETLAVLYHVVTCIFLPIYAVLVPLFLLITPLCVFVWAYAAWYYYDYSTPFRGARPKKWYRNLSIWNRFCDYFPIKLVKTAELSPEHNYIVGSHPHGILSFGIFGTFCTEGAGFSQTFPGIQPFVATLNANFYAPFRKELMTCHGLISAAKESIMYNLTGEKKGNAVAIVLGGAEEALDAASENYNLTLKKRKGFVKIALRTG
uniref:diacylglycerol O-acyltransferase n=1 Tax=Steinernema glaseri TaxID=37863 RepID=A0A1I7ZL11_9BILA